MAQKTEKNELLTVFKSDRYEDVVAIIFSGLIVIAILTYMAFFLPPMDIKAAQDGKLVELFAVEGATVKPGDKLYTLEVVKKKSIDNQEQEYVALETFSSKSAAKVLKVLGNPGDEVKKGKDTLIILGHEKGTLP